MLSFRKPAKPAVVIMPDSSNEPCRCFACCHHLRSVANDGKLTGAVAKALSIPTK